MNKRNGAVVLVAYCTLNQNAVLPAWERARGPYPFLRTFVDHGIGIIQLPCPEMCAKGIDRPPLERDDYDTPAHRALCQKILRAPLEALQAHLSYGDRFLGIIGINESPNCGIGTPPGIFMEILQEELKNNDIPLRFIEVPTSYREGDLHEETLFNDQLERWITEGIL